MQMKLRFICQLNKGKVILESQNSVRLRTYFKKIMLSVGEVNLYFWPEYQVSLKLPVFFQFCLVMF